jgi:hypothetical protein
MSLQSLRTGVRESREPALYELDAIRLDGRSVAIALSVRQAEDGVWRGRLEFTEPDLTAQRATAEIFCGRSEDDLWQSVRALGQHHLRDLYRSLL